MLHKLIESVTTTTIIATAFVFVIGYILVKWFAWMARKEEEKPVPFDERDCYL